MVRVDERPCVFCHSHKAEAPWKPFCSQRCKLQDLAKWVDGDYRVGGEPIPQHDEESGEDEDGPWPTR
jgi:endogenous inhibitor of DNA gyrase (YacG/DUF329 family)